MMRKELVSAAALFWGIFGGAALPEPVRELANINGASITERDIQTVLSGYNEGQRAKILSDIHSREKILGDLIDQELLGQEAQKKGIEKSAEYVDAMRAFRRQLLSGLLLKSTVDSQITEKAAKDFYARNKYRYTSDLVRVQHILLGSEAEANALLQKAKDPSVEFQALAEKYSKDTEAKNNRGDIGYISRFQFDPTFTDVAFTAKVGEVVGPVQTAYGYHLIKVVDHKYGKTMDYAEVEVFVRTALRQELVRKYLGTIRRSYKVRYPAAN